MPNRTSRSVSTAYFLTLAALVAAAFRPESWRVWGLDAWAHAPPVLLGATAVAGLAAPWALAGAARLGKRSPRAARLAGAIALAGFLAAFWFLRTRGHFLGDGYQNLAALAADRGAPKASSRGTAAVLAVLRDLGGGGEPGALAAFRTLAILSGAAYLAVVLAAARRLVPEPDRPGFVALFALGGPVVLFFGYVEHYAPFVLAVTAHTLHGIHVARTGRTRPLAPVIVAAAVALHVLGWLLLPSLAWILLAGTGAARALRSVPRRVRIGGAALAPGIVVVVLAFLRERNLALHFLLVPFRKGSYTLDGYTLLSPAHLGDLANLAVLLLPGALVLATAAASSRAAWPGLRRDPALPFLAILIASTTGAVVLLDPRLGMPRDWDLFSFVGIPWIAAGAILWSAAARARPAVRPAAGLAAVLGLLVLAGRVTVLADEERAMASFRDRLELDPSRGRTGRYHLVAHYRRLGDDERADAEAAAWDRDYPERVYLRNGRAAKRSGDLEDAARWYDLALRRNPQYPDAYNNLADLFLVANLPDEAVESLRIALALNPGEYAPLVNLGFAERMRGNDDGAAAAWREALAANPDGFEANRQLAELARERGDRETYERRLARAAASPDATDAVRAEWAGTAAGRAAAGDAETDAGRE